MNQLLLIAFSVAIGIVIGTLPGMREKFPWGQPAPPPRPVAPAEADTSGSWKYDHKSSLNVPPGPVRYKSN